MKTMADLQTAPPPLRATASLFPCWPRSQDPCHIALRDLSAPRPKFCGCCDSVDPISGCRQCHRSQGSRSQRHPRPPADTCGAVPVRRRPPPCECRVKPRWSIVGNCHQRGNATDRDAAVERLGQIGLYLQVPLSVTLGRKVLRWNMVEVREDLSDRGRSRV